MLEKQKLGHVFDTSTFKDARKKNLVQGFGRQLVRQFCGNLEPLICVLFSCPFHFSRRVRSMHIAVLFTPLNTVNILCIGEIAYWYRH